MRGRMMRYGSVSPPQAVLPLPTLEMTTVRVVRPGRGAETGRRPVWSLMVAAPVTIAQAIYDRAVVVVTVVARAARAAVVSLLTSHLALARAYVLGLPPPEGSP